MKDRIGAILLALLMTLHIAAPLAVSARMAPVVAGADSSCCCPLAGACCIDACGCDVQEGPEEAPSPAPLTPTRGADEHRALLTGPAESRPVVAETAQAMSGLCERGMAAVATGCARQSRLCVWRT
ncbi:MAG: hypothetical protein VYC34_10685 [Planctomycetota bacterium]|nr:hypothetical protein [Planctomycetota bacterium]